ncbi:phosphomannomutase/phosphoglucomutase [Rehaibacterium terrae]|jgi:phosphomannomutase/phosphoglucomutase|uniref:phosphomannomutase n=1 Tax=Rehaibacterium terrae TaxID=1341696 RepID=A0A7W7Y153_9GAMM|nr:phosphomannomutase/phosphoglucomutase [Rehaibacterium terrae]MBB5016191.1 phosphomannomutase/phosphoglucomutase [Rehaibacterium terrae]
MSNDTQPAAARRLAIPVQVHRFLPLIGAVLIALGALVLWQSWQAGAAERLAAQLDGRRDQAAADVRQQLDGLLQRFGEHRQRESVLAALREDDTAAAAQALQAGWPELVGVEFHPPALDEAIEGDLAAFGYGRLALLQDALVAGAPRAAVIRDGGQPTLALVGPVTDGNRVLALALVKLPVGVLAERLQAATPAGLYLGLKQGRFLIAEAGKRELAALAEARAVPIPGSGMRIVAAAPEVRAGLLSGGLGYGLGGLLLLAGAGAFVLQRRSVPQAAMADEGGAEAASDVTLAEVMQRSAAASQPRVVREKPARRALTLDRSIFRAYDIRGVVGQTLDAGIARLIGQAIGSLMHEKGLKDIVVGRDGRLSGPELVEGLIAGLRQAGCDVTDIGMVPTPVVYFGSFHLRTGSGVAVTGSHNPPDYNGFKIVVGGETLSGAAIEALYTRIVEDRMHSAQPQGTLQRRDISHDYTQRIAQDVQTERPLKVVVDCGNGVAGAIAPQVLEAIGCEVVPLHCEVDGTFPNHHPDPGDPENLSDLIHMVQRLDADLGVAFDGDGDRLGVVTRRGEIIYPDRLLMLFAQDVLSRNPGACILYDVKCTGHLAGHVLRHGGSPVMWKTGHSLIKAKMKETEAELAGEMSGHFFFRERWYGFDDGIYAAARLLEIIAADPRAPEEVFDELPKGVSTPELKIPVAEGEQYVFVEAFRDRAKFDGARVATIDGVRADWPDGFGLVRASNTTPVIVLRFDADNAEAMARIQQAFREQLLALKPDLALPF